MGLFKERENAVINYIKDNLPNFLGDKPDFDRYVNDYLNPDGYKDDKIFFFNFGSYDLEPFQTGADSGRFMFDVFMLFRNEEPEELHEQMLDYADAFYEMFKASNFNFGGAVDMGLEVNVNFYNAAQGNNNLKICVMTFTTASEM